MMKALALLTLALLPGSPAGAAPPAGKLFQRMIVVVLENTSYDEALSQPFLTGLAKRGALLTNFDAEAHPSQPNYIALVAGSTQGVSGDGNVNLGELHLGDLLEAHGYDWRAYAEDYPGRCFLGESQGKYARKHVPFLSFRNVQTNPARCAKVVEAGQFDADVKAGSLPAFSLYVPNLNNDGHDTNPTFADAWLKNRFGALLDEPAFASGTLFVVTFDENDDALGWGGRNQIFTALAGPMVRAGSVVTDPLNHYSLLRLVEDNWALGSLTKGDATAGLISGIWLP